MVRLGTWNVTDVTRSVLFGDILRSWSFFLIIKICCVPVTSQNKSILSKNRTRMVVTSHFSFLKKMIKKPKSNVLWNDELYCIIEFILSKAFDSVQDDALAWCGWHSELINKRYFVTGLKDFRSKLFFPTNPFTTTTADHYISLSMLSNCFV